MGRRDSCEQDSGSVRRRLEATVTGRQTDGSYTHKNKKVSLLMAPSMRQFDRVHHLEEEKQAQEDLQEIESEHRSRKHIKSKDWLKRWLRR